MKTARIHAWLIGIKSVLITAYYSLELIIKNSLGTLTRQHVDKRLQLWVDAILRAARVQYRIINPHQVEPIPGQATIVISNHTSIYDIPLCYKAFPQHSIRMLAKKELANVPFMGRAMKTSEFPFINRRDQKQAFEDLNATKKLMQSGIVMWIFAEGTRSKDARLAPLKKGAFITALETQAVIIPVGIRGAYNILPARSFDLYLNQTAEIHIGKPIDTKDYTLEEKQSLIDKVSQDIKTLIGEV